MEELHSKGTIPFQVDIKYYRKSYRFPSLCITNTIFAYIFPFIDNLFTKFIYILINSDNHITENGVAKNRNLNVKRFQALFFFLMNES